MEKEKDKLKKQFEEESGFHWLNSQGEPDIDYVDWLEYTIIEQLDLIQSLYDLQNGPPLVKYEKDWNEVMKKIDKHLDKIY